MSGYIGNIPVPQATQTRDTFTATAGQTTFATSGYTPSFLDAYLNGVKLVNGTDFTATNGSDVVLTSGAAAGDTLEVVSYSTFEVNSQTFTGTTTLTGDLQATTATFSGAVTGTDATLSGGVYLGGTGSANYLDDYEYGDYQVTFTPSGGGSMTVASSHNDLKYTKIGSRVFVTGKVDISAVSSPSGYIAVNLPFVIHNSGTANDSRRFTGSIWVFNAAIETYKFQLYGIEGESSVRIYNGSGTGLASTAANQFSGDEGVAFSFNYETTP